MSEGVWLSLLEYANYRNKSISTVRRYIKNKSIKFKDENGKYYIWAAQIEKKKLGDEKRDLELKFQMELLQKENRELKEENDELKMLISIYEAKISPLPKLPNIEGLN